MAPTPPPPPPRPAWPIPKLRLDVSDLKHQGAILFFGNVNPVDALRDAVVSVLSTLYTLDDCPRHVRSVTLYLQDMGGVAYTMGSSLDNDHKEIHFSLQHIANNEGRARDEVLGVLVHEMVHCFQHDARGTCPGGLIEGVADYVRLKARLDPPHWSRGGDKWDDGYERTAYFLEWIEEEHPGFVRRLNARMAEAEFDEGLFEELTSTSLEALWKSYKRSLAPKEDST